MPKRTNPAAGVHLGLGELTIVLLTVTTHKRTAWLANSTAHMLLHRIWQQATAWKVGDYLIMPDHLHAFCSPAEQGIPIEKWIAYWKRQFRLKHRRSDWRFQARGWHHRLRDDESYAERWDYVQQNPVRAGLVEKPEDWPFKGKVFDLRWLK